MNVAKFEIKLDLSQTLNNNKIPQQINELFRSVSDLKGQTNNFCKENPQKFYTANSALQNCNESLFCSVIWARDSEMEETIIL